MDALPADYNYIDSKECALLLQCMQCCTMKLGGNAAHQLINVLTDLCATIMTVIKLSRG